MNEKNLPDKSGFHNLLYNTDISDEDYLHAKKIMNPFKLKNMREFHDLYLKTDVILLADVFENFRKVCKKNYGLDPAWYYTSPGLAWDAMLKMTGIELDLLSDPQMYLMIENGIRGGISTVSKRHARANNKYMKNYNPKEKTKHIIYLDANNLYGWAMTNKLLVRNFKWMSKKELQDWKNFPCILEVDLEYPKELHELHKEYPLAAKKIKVENVEKLIPNL